MLFTLCLRLVHNFILVFKKLIVLVVSRFQYKVKVIIRGDGIMMIHLVSG